MNDDAVLMDFYYNTAYNFADLPLSEPWEIYHFPLLFLSLHILSVLCKKHWMKAAFTMFSAQREGRIKILDETSLNLSTTLPQSQSSQDSQVTELLPDCSSGARTWRDTSDLRSGGSVGSTQFCNSKGTNTHTQTWQYSHTASASLRKT